MCGIAGIHVKKPYVGRFPVGRMMDHLLLGNQWRGQDATGYLALHNETQVKIEKCDVRADQFVQMRDPVPSQVRTLLLHTRAWTKGTPTVNANNHPVVYGTCYAVHNGHISNDDAIFREYDLNRGAEVDSEAIPASIFYHGWSHDDIKTALESLSGGFAIAALDPEQAPGKLLLAKGPMSPLYILNTKKALIWSSTQSAIEKAWGVTLGTPPTRKATPKDGDWLGMFELQPGQLLMIEDDDMELRTFHIGKQAPRGSHNVSTFRGGSQSSQKSTQSSGVGSFFSGGRTPYDDCGIPDCAACAHGYPAYCDAPWMADDSSECLGSRCNGCTDENCFARFWVKDPTDGYIRRPDPEKYRIWTCQPSYEDCIHPCVEGCNGPNCVCYKGSPRHPEMPAHKTSGATSPMGGVPDVPGNGTARSLSLVRDSGVPGVSSFVNIDGASGTVIEGTITQMECDGCLQMFPPHDLFEQHGQPGGDKVLYCSNCSMLARTRRTKARIKSADDMQAEVNHMRAIHEVAVECDTKAAFVQWIIFECPKENYQGEENAWMAKLRDDLAAEYDNAIVIAERLANGDYRR